VIFARGIPLHAAGSVQDRVMREMVFRERQEKVAHMHAFTQIVAQLFNLDADRVFGSIVGRYAGEVFQETYDAELLKEKMEAIRRAQQRVRAIRIEREQQLTRLDRLGEFYDLKLGPDLIPKPEVIKETIKPFRPVKPIKAPG
jgi:hypothetical protein